jgi:hypothetical protein
MMPRGTLNIIPANRCVFLDKKPAEVENSCSMVLVMRGTIQSSILAE